MSNTKVNKIHYLYELWVEGDEKPFYVGRTCDPANRMACHWKDSGGREAHLPKSKKLVKAKREGLEIEMRIVFETSDFDTICEAERRRIAVYGRFDSGGPLYNLTDGGEGHENYVWSEEARARASERMKGSRLNCGRSRPDMKKRMSNEVYAFRRDGTLVGKFPSQKEAAWELGCNEASVGKCILGKARCCRGESDVYWFSHSLVENPPIFPHGTIQGDNEKKARKYTRPKEWRENQSKALRSRKNMHEIIPKDTMEKLVLTSSYDEIAKQYGVSIGQVYRHRVACGIPSPPPRKMK